MIQDKRIVAILPTYSVPARLAKTYRALPHDIVDEVVVSCAGDGEDWESLLRQLGLKHVVECSSESGHGDHQRSCYTRALELGADVVVQIGSGYRYDLGLLTAMATFVSSGSYDLVLGSRVLGQGSNQNGMPWRRRSANRILTALQNFLLGERLSEYHSGYRVFSRKLLARLPLRENSSLRVFDNQLISQALLLEFAVGEVTAPATWWPEPGQGNFGADLRYALGVIHTSACCRLQKCRLRRYDFLNHEGKRLAGRRSNVSTTTEAASSSAAP